MKLNTLFFAVAYLGISYMSLTQDVQPPSNIEDPYNLLRANLRKQQEQASLESPTIDVLFFDINHDGIPEVLISIRENHYCPKDFVLNE